MRLLTTILPRRSGTVTLLGADGKTSYVFKPDDFGALVCDVPDEATIAMALKTGDFEPCDADDHERAAKLLGPIDGDLPPDDDIDDDEGSPDAPPVEANTPPVPPASQVAVARRKAGKTTR